MNTAFLKIFHCDERCPLLLDLGLAATALFLWFLLGCFQVHIAVSRAILDLAVANPRWQPQIPLGPWLLGAGSLLLVYLRLRFPLLGTASRAFFYPRLRQVALFTFVLLLVRIATFWQPLTYLFPFLGILWSPHSTWSLCLLYVFYLHFSFDADSSSRPLSPKSRNRIAVLLFAAGILVYGLYTLYFCQVTMLHGDEGQYLRVTQSLLRDGDMDLANNLDIEQTNEFHVRVFDVHEAPGSPPGKVHSVHPIGLSVALLPAYWVGLELWENPRLSTALCMALMAAACLPLAFIWLTRLGVGSLCSLLGVGILGLTAPFFYYTNQLFPETPALLLTLCVLVPLAHWQVPGGGFRSWGRLQSVLPGLLGLLLAALPFLHARYTPIALLGGALLLLQTWHSPQRRAGLAGLGLVAVLALYGLLSFNYAFSGDWMGPFRPGNAWGKGALDITTWAISLPGHWLQADKGILNCSPIYLLCPLGWAVVSLRRDRRLLLIGGLYLATAGINGLHPEWGFGFCYPARFLTTALPVLLYGLVLALPLIARRTLPLFLTAVLLTISLESITQTLILTEIGYDGRNLDDRSINHFYPWEIHFFSKGHDSFPLLDLSFWLLLLSLLFLLLIRPKSLPRRALYGVGLLAALLPFIWGRSDAIAARLDDSASVFNGRLVPEKSVRGPDPIQYQLHSRFLNAGKQQPDGRFAARSPEDTHGIISSAYMPLLIPGLYHLSFPNLDFDVPPSQVAGHLSVSRRYTVPAVSRWENRLSWPLVGGVPAPENFIFRSDHTTLGYTYVEFSGSGEISYQRGGVRFYPISFSLSTEEIHRFVHEEERESIDEPIVLGAFYPELDPGHYRVHYTVEGSTFPTLFQRRPTPISMAVYTNTAGSQERRSHLETLAYFWLQHDRTGTATVGSPTFLRPQIESHQPPWWLSVPFVGDNFFELHFQLTEKRDAWFLLRYDGREDLQAKETVLYKVHLKEL